MAKAKMAGTGWHGQSLRHSNARKFGRAGGRYAGKWVPDIEMTRKKGIGIWTNLDTGEQLPASEIAPLYGYVKKEPDTSAMTRDEARKKYGARLATQGISWNEESVKDEKDALEYAKYLGENNIRTRYFFKKGGRIFFQVHQYPDYGKETLAGKAKEIKTDLKNQR